MLFQHGELPITPECLKPRRPKDAIRRKKTMTKDEVMDFLESGYWEILGQKRHAAAVEFLSRAPEEVTDRLEREIFLLGPHKETLGQSLPWEFVPVFMASKPNPPGVRPSIFKEPDPNLPRRAKVNFIYLSPRLESLSSDAGVGILAHEVAHGFVGILGNGREEKAWKLARKWGFGREVDVARAEADRL